jgi:catechol 2,3-dioxygenase-like lactoylglutathione lyase family enzyme
LPLLSSLAAGAKTSGPKTESDLGDFLLCDTIIPPTTEALMIQGIDNIGLCVTDVARSVAFYQALGFLEQYRNERGVMMSGGGANLFIFATRQANPPQVGRELGLFGNAQGIDHISLAVMDVDALCSMLVAAGIPVDNPPENQTWGARMAGLKDPDGNNLYLLQKL